MNKYSHLDYHQSFISEIHEESLKHLFTETLVVKSNVDTDQVKVKSFSRLASIVIEGRGRKRMVAQETSSGLEPGRMIISDARSVSTILLYDSDERGGQKMSTNDGAVESRPRKDHTSSPLAWITTRRTHTTSERSSTDLLGPKFIGLHRRWLDRDAPLFYHLCGGQNSSVGIIASVRDLSINM